MKKFILSWGSTLLLLFFSFTQTVQAQCTATDECFDFTFNGAQQLVNNMVRLSYTIKTNCKHALSYAAFELPAGVIAVNPKAAIYKYTVENSTNRPFYSIKFESKRSEGYKNGGQDTFTFEIPNHAYATLTSVKLQAKAATIVGTVSIDISSCIPCSTGAPGVALKGPNTLCNIADYTYRFEVMHVQQGVTYTFTLPEGFIIEEEGNGYVNVIALFEEDQLMIPQSIVVTAMNTCGQTTANKQVKIIDCNLENPLPVSLTRFDGISRNGKVELNWTTAVEINNERFEIQRSYDGKTFALAGQVDGNGSSTVSIEYAFSDVNVNLGTVYYRLRQVDFDGKFDYSEIIAVKHFRRTTTNFASIFPNPVTEGRINIRFADAQPTNGNVQIFDLKGRILCTKNIPSDTALVTLLTQSIGLAQGVYLICINISDNTTTQRLVIQ